MKRFFIVIISLIILQHSALADVGMWVPLFINKNIAEMQRQGLKLSASDLYDINNASLKDAVVIFGGGCTGEMVSAEGLLFTNYHCGYDAIQKLSSVQHDYLTNGFWAMNKQEELPCEGLSVQFLISIEDVTEQVFKNTNDITDDTQRNKIINSNCHDIEYAATCEDKTLNAVVESFYGGNQYLLYKYKVYTDVRLVGAPPSEIGKFGGDTDNWVWPRHTGDFSIFRVYADKDNNPSEYCSTNVPYKPKKHLQINAKGVSKGDFTMVMGFPGSTDLYAPSVEVANIQNIINPMLVELRTAKLNVMNKYQEQDAKINIQYASKNASTSNAWKKWQGEIKGLRKINAIARKQAVEAELVKRNPAAKALLDQYNTIYTNEFTRNRVNRTYINEIFRGGVELVRLARIITYQEYDDNGAYVQKDFDSFYRDYDYNLSREMAIEVMKVYCRNIPSDKWPKELLKKGMTIEKFINNIYTKSALRNEATAAKLLKDGRITLKKIEKDPAYKFFSELSDIYRNQLSKEPCTANAQALPKLNQQYIKAMLEAYPDSLLPSDANFTMRISYGHIEGYEADDAVAYSEFTTLDGIIEKYKTGNPDFTLPLRLKELYESRAYADYADSNDGKLHVAFVATNHTTGGNSGSPVLDADGQLIGLNFDRAWNGVMSDIVFNPLQCRNITLDIRYLLFIVDKYAGAGYLLNEMDIIK